MLSIYNKISDYIIILDFKGNIKFSNESFLKRLDYSYEELLNLNINEIIKKKDNNIENILKESYDTNKVLEFSSKSNEIIQINSNISIESFNNDENIFIIGKEVKLKKYNKEILEELLDNINGCAYILDDEGKYIYVNDSFEKDLNKSKRDIIGTYNSNHWDVEVCMELEKNNKEVKESKRPKLFREKIKVGDDVQWYKSYKIPVFDENNKFKYMLGVSKNINLTKKESEELYKTFNKATIESKYNEDIYENTYFNKLLNDIGEKVLDYTGADGISILMYDKEKDGLIPTVKLKKCEKCLKDISFIPLKKIDIDRDEKRAYFNCRIGKRDINIISNLNYNYIDELNHYGNYIMQLSDEFMGIIALGYSGENSPKLNSDEYMEYICSEVAMMIKGMKLSLEVNKANKKQRVIEKEMEMYLKVSTDLVSVVGKDGYLKKISPSWIDVLGWSEEELFAMKISEIVHPEDVEDFKNGKKIDKLEGMITRNIIRFRHKNGNYIYLEWSCEYIVEYEVFITTARDITNKLEIEKEKVKLEEAIKLEIIKNEFFSNISHEFRTPINIILGTMQVIDRNMGKNNIEIEDLKRYINYIKQNSYRLLRLVNNLIDISKIDIGSYSLKYSNENIISIIEDITLSVVDYMKNNNINLLFDTNEEEVITSCDADIIERIMLNLLSNAIKCTPDDGFIEVSINSNENEVMVSVKDSGVGIPKDKLDIIFDRFNQVDRSLNRKFEGSGIGLSLVKNLVEMHGGEVSVKSKVNEGSEFIFTIPIKLTEENKDNIHDADRKYRHVERCDIEFSDIYNI